MKQGEVSLSIRIDLANGSRFGPGKAALLMSIDEYGSISKAASVLGMSYPRALKLIDEMNGPFVEPLVVSTHGGTSRGGSELTKTGRKVLALYHSITEMAVAQNIAAIKNLNALQNTE